MDGINELLHISKYYHITGVKIYYCVYVCGGGGMRTSMGLSCGYFYGWRLIASRGKNCFRITSHEFIVAQILIF